MPQETNLASYYETMGKVEDRLTDIDENGHYGMFDYVQIQEYLDLAVEYLLASIKDGSFTKRSLYNF